MQLREKHGRRYGLMLSKLKSRFNAYFNSIDSACYFFISFCLPDSEKKKTKLRFRALFFRGKNENKHLTMRDESFGFKMVN